MFVWMGQVHGHFLTIIKNSSALFTLITVPICSMNYTVTLDSRRGRTSQVYPAPSLTMRASEDEDGSPFLGNLGADNQGQEPETRVQVPVLPQIPQASTSSSINRANSSFPEDCRWLEKINQLSDGPPRCLAHSQHLDRGTHTRITTR